MVLRTLMTIRQNQVEAVLARLDGDLLMKYVYRGFESPSDGRSAHLLFWHDKIFELTGSMGSIVRVLSDRKRV